MVSPTLPIKGSPNSTPGCCQVSLKSSYPSQPAMPHPNCPTFSVPVGIPVYGIAFTLSNQLLLGGGGGGGRTGVKNKLVSVYTERIRVPLLTHSPVISQISYKVEPRRKDIEEEAVYEVPEGEDAPMCLDTHPTASTDQVVEQRPPRS